MYSSLLCHSEPAVLSSEEGEGEEEEEGERKAKKKKEAEVSSILLV